MPDYMFMKVEDEEKPLSFIKNENGEIIPEDAKSNEGSEATAEPMIGYEQNHSEEEIDKRYQRFLRMTE